jgi:FkbM family methyltransferase
VAVASENCDLEVAVPTRAQRIDVKLEAEDWDNTGTISVFGKGEKYREKVRGIKLDDIVERRVDLLKLDIEGSELEALKGAHRILSEDKPIIQIELRPRNLAMAGTDVHEVHRYIQSYGYVRIGKHAGDSVYCHSSMDHNKISEYKLRQLYSAPSELLFKRFRVHLTKKDVEFLRQIHKVKAILNVYDVGACIGVLSLLFASAFGDVVVHAIEPATLNFGYLEHNTASIERIFPKKYALSNRNGTIKIAMPTIEQRPEMTEETIESSALISVYGESDLYSEEVPVHRLDDVAIGTVDLLKIDAEGHECEVLEGAERVLLEDRPIVFLNLRKGTQNMAGRTRLELREKIGSYGYKRVGHYRGDAIYFPEELELPEDVPMEMSA